MWIERLHVWCALRNIHWNDFRNDVIDPGRHEFAEHYFAAFEKGAKYFSSKWFRFDARGLCFTAPPFDATSPAGRQPITSHPPPKYLAFVAQSPVVDLPSCSHRRKKCFFFPHKNTAWFNVKGKQKKKKKKENVSFCQVALLRSWVYITSLNLKKSYIQMSKWILLNHKMTFTHKFACGWKADIQHKLCFVL